MFQDEIGKLKSKNLYRELKYFNYAKSKKAKINEKEYIMFSSNSYLGLLNDERLLDAAKDAIDLYGVGTGGSRLTTGSFVLHKQLEKELAGFKKTEDCILFGSGYMANVGVISAIAKNGWTIFCDRLNHASIIDGCTLSKGKLVIYKHSNIEDLEKKLKKYCTQNSILVTDGIFSMDGDIALLPDIVKLSKKFGFMIMVDDAHATGVLGENGTGTCEYFNIKDEVHVQMGTLSKAFSSEGGYVAGKEELIDYLRNKAKTFIYSTSLAPVNISISLKVLEIMRNNKNIIRELNKKAVWFKKEIRNIGFNTIDNITPIVPIIIGDTNKTMEFSKILLNEGFYISAIRPPTVPNGTSRLRISLMASHTFEDMRDLISSMKDIGMNLGVL